MTMQQFIALLSKYLFYFSVPCFEFQIFDSRVFSIKSRVQVQPKLKVTKEMTVRFILIFDLRLDVVQSERTKQNYYFFRIIFVSSRVDNIDKKSSSRVTHTLCHTHTRIASLLL